MDWELVRRQMQDVLGIAVNSMKRSAEEWAKLAKEQGAGPIGADPGVTDGDYVYIPVQQESQDMLLFQFPAAGITDRERALIGLMLDARKTQERKAAAPSGEEERKASLIREWFKGQQELGYTQAELPDALVSQMSLYSTKIPLLVYVDQTTSRRVHYTDLKKLLESFFDASITLIPLTDKEWLVLGPEKILAMDGGEDRPDTSEESLEDRLAALGYGLHEMLENEWVGECHLAVHYPMLPAKSLYSAILQLRETIMLGRTYHIGSNMHLPWELQLEKLVHLIPDSEKASFLERALKRLDLAFDPETMTTLDHFFQLDCNVSETAKKLYIHRNTLLYRLDKFKQETGLDVRTFNHAVLVKIAMLLYKVTKRK
ncbi:PucR C-terminal helix-turn-helix domain-containing protein [Paenibacillus sp. UNCCL117]|uniref:PucR family transcriptional regulator n=1 Tax=unclassified Paenibacillus TaxID=185978 RepID=UPI00088C2A58|nr:MULTISPECIES: helix-turn-helix domain-containing protein [unclassified Paenibacillus]SDD52795.1 PucR C-terminal helix-turn-helix domain-containing protein [Paenibacillus sp. cl123]SFW49233.1 PucR C-terminal helix-turn-helix domain-containing protein [Paenibacillus sp. UNCCL117]